MTFRFDSATHSYWIDSVQVPSISELLERTGHVDSTFMTQEGRDRGTAVHELCAAHDLDALDLETCNSPYRGYLLAYVKALSIIRPVIFAVELPAVHPQYRFGGRPDRDVSIGGVRSVMEIKSGAPERSHSLQTALQALLVSTQIGLPPEALGRFSLYLKPTGKFKLEEHKARRDFDEARRIVAKCCYG